MKFGLILSEIVAAQELCEHFVISNECIEECNEIKITCKGLETQIHSASRGFFWLVSKIFSFFTENCGDDAACLHKCNLDMNNCSNDCPCMANCPQGCDDCPYCSCIWPEKNEDYLFCYESMEYKYFECFIGCGVGRYFLSVRK